MYSIYRAWFGGEDYPRLEALAPPDTLVRVGNEGEYHFVAHRSVLAAHSGYLKALLATTAAAGAAADGATTAAHDGAPPIITSLTVPSTIGGEAFAPLLNYMYTGRLEVTLENIYTVLLATHLLHMPGALEECRAALLRLRAPLAVPPTSASPPPPPPPPSQSSQQQSGSVLRPVPNRLLGPAFCWPPTTATAGHLYPPRHLELPHLPALQLPPAISVLPAPIIHKTTLSYGTTKEPSVSPASSASQHRRSRSRSRSASPELVVASSSASSITHRSSNSDDQQPAGANTTPRQPSPSISNERISVSDSGGGEQQTQSKRRKTSQQQPQQPGSGGSRQRQNSRSGRSSHGERSSSSSRAGAGTGTVQTPGVVYDVACCDGPVRFHRVLNENYAPATAQTPTGQQHRSLVVAQCNGRSSNCRDADVTSPSLNSCRENDENDRHQLAQQSSTPTNSSTNSNSSSNAENQQRSSNSNGGGSYTCGYCRHTFKSQYCYRKHASRHLLPTDSGDNTERPQLVQPPRQTPPAQPETKKREVRLLDLNVQYYPCKICGSKFPSYYFVHKHRKLCHANVDEQQQSQNRSSGANDSVDEPIKSAQQQQPSTSENVQQQQQQQQLA